MTDYVQIKNIDGLKASTTQNMNKPIPETIGTSNAITVHNDKNIKVNTIKQSNLTSNCWLVQMNGFEACADCQFYTFNRKTGKLKVTSQCGGGQTLALMLKTFGMSMYDKCKASEFWKAHPNASFTKFVQSMQKQGRWEHPLRKYKNKIKDLYQIATEKQSHQQTQSLNELYPYTEISTNPNAKRIIATNSHYPTQCTCETGYKKTAYRDETYTFEDKTIYYYHQHAIAVKTKDSITFDSCGFRTSTTKERINNYLPQPYRLYQDSHKWFIEARRWNEQSEHWESVIPQDIEFYDGLTLKVETPCLKP
ncbi:MAG: hypothetical protein WC365_08340 [Candidatus Babeliales bacterium]|jgi:hypothetical protein